MGRALYEVYHGVECFKRYYPKAAKKKRIVKKWIKRFGDPFIWETVLDINPFLSLLPKDESYEGKYLPLPIIRETDI